MLQLETLVTITRSGMGHAEGELPLDLLGTWLKVTLANGTLPGAIACYTDGVRVACAGSPVLDDLKAFEDQGVHVILCKTCLDRFDLAEKVSVGIVGGMGDIVAAQVKATKVVHL